MHIVHENVLIAVTNKFSSDEKLFHRKLNNIKKQCSNLEAFGCDPVFNLFAVTKELKNLMADLGNRKTPLEKVVMMKTILNALNEELTKCVSATVGPFDDTPKKKVETDDLVAALIFLLLSCDRQKIVSDLKYIEYFSWHTTQNEYAYSLVTFQVAVGYVNNSCTALENVSRDAVSIPSRKRGNSFLDYCRQSSSQLDHDLEKITKLIESKVSINDTDMTRTTTDTLPSEELG